MLKIAGKPILKHTLEALPKKVSEVILITGYLGNKIKKYFGNKFLGKKLRYVHQKTQDGTFHALKLTKRLLKNNSFLLLAGDDLYHKKDIEKIAKYKLAVLVKESKHPERFGVCLKDKKWFLKEIIEKPKNPPSNLVNTGAYALTRDIFSESVIYHKNEQVLAPMIGNLAKKKKIKVIKAKFWHPIGYKEDLEKAERIIKNLKK